jgi:signal transduction histidine kinase
VALQTLCDHVQAQGDVACVFDCPEDLLVDDNTVATQLFRIAQEAIANSRKHSKACRLTVRLYRDRDLLELQIADDGVGFDPDLNWDDGMGLRILRHRSELIGGTLSIESDPSGTVVRCELRNDDTRR